MAGTFEDNVQMLRELQNEHTDRKKMQAGRYDPATGLEDPNIYNGLDPGFIWVRDRGSRVAVPALMSVLTAMCAVRFGDLLRTGINEEGDREAIAPYIIRQNVNKLNQVLYESKKLTPTTTESLEGGIVRAPDTPALKLYIGANDALGWAGGLIDISSGDVPTNANESRWLVVYFTGAYGAAPTYTTTTARVAASVDSFKTLYLTDAFTKALPNKAIRHWGVTLGYGQTTITYTNSRFVHLRNIYNPDWLVTVDTTSAVTGYVPTWNSTLGTWAAGALSSTSLPNFGTAATKTLASDVASAGSDRNLVIAAQTGTADNLIEITGLAVGDAVIVRADAGDTITVKHNDAGATDKLLLSGAADFALTGNQMLLLVKTESGKVIQPLDEDTGSSGIGDYIVIREKQTLGTYGGTFTSGADQTRLLNEELVDTGGHASLASNQITLAAGTYRFNIRAPAFAVDQHVAWLYNVTDSTDVEIGTAEFLNNALGTQGHSTIIGRMTIAATKVFEVRHRCTTTRATDGFGTRSNLKAEVYTVAQFWRE